MRNGAQSGPIGGPEDRRVPGRQAYVASANGGKSVPVSAFDAVEQVAAAAKCQSSPVHRRGCIVTRGCSRETDNNSRTYREAEREREREKEKRFGSEGKKGRGEEDGGRERERERERSGEVETQQRIGSHAQTRVDHSEQCISGQSGGMVQKESYPSKRMIPIA